MSYTLEQLAADCRSALSKGTGPAELEEVRTYVAKALLDADLVATHRPADCAEERRVL